MRITSWVDVSAAEFESRMDEAHLKIVAVDQVGDHLLLQLGQLELHDEGKKTQTTLRTATPYWTEGHEVILVWQLIGDEAFRSGAEMSERNMRDNCDNEYLRRNMGCSRSCSWRATAPATRQCCCLGTLNACMNNNDALCSL